MTFKIFNQYDPSWSGHALGAELHELGPYGCFLCVIAMVLWDSFADSHYNPAQLDDQLQGLHIFADDVLPNNALDRLRPDRFKTSGWYAGYRADVIASAVAAPDRYAWLHVSGYSPLWKMVCDHYVLAFGGTKIADPAGGVVRDISAYGGPASIKGVTVCQKLAPPPPAAATPPVVVNQKPPILIPVVVAVPDPLFTWKADDGYRSERADVYDVAATLAASYALLHVGVLVEVIAKDGSTVKTEYVAPPPSAVALPIVATTPAPAHVQQPDFWALLQSALIRIILSLRRR